MSKQDRTIQSKEFKDWNFEPENESPFDKWLHDYACETAALTANELLKSVEIWKGKTPGKIQVIFTPDNNETETSIEIDLQRDIVDRYLWEDDKTINAWVQVLRKLIDQIQQHAKYDKTGKPRPEET